MTAPQTGALQFGWACLIGGGLGLLYGFLRPLRPRHTVTADLIFMAGVFLGWLQWGFGICRADLRPAGFLGMGLGGILWEITAGRWLRPVFGAFWRTVGKVWNFLLWPGKNF